MQELDSLVAAARAGGGWAFARLWEELAPAVASYLRARGVRDPDDVTSEVFLAAFRGIDRFCGDGRAFTSWVFAIAHHKRVDTVRAAPRRDLPVGGSDDLDVVEGRRPGVRRTEPSAENAALGRIGTADVMQLLGELTDDQRDVILLRVVGDLSLQETADILDKPVGAVKALQHRALNRLRTRLSRPQPAGTEAGVPPVSPGAPAPMWEAR